VIVAAPSDPQVVDQVLTQAGVDRAMPDPGWSGYLDALAEALVDVLGRVSSPMGEVLAHYGRLVAIAVVLLVALIGGWLALTLVQTRRARRGLAATRRGPDVALVPVAAPPRDAGAWRAALERALAAGEVGPALEALWWWFACTVAGTEGIERSSTSRELVARMGRAELAAPARELDRWLYGPRRPDVGEIRGLLVRLEHVIS
jgi:hypothetical protein